MLSIPCVDVELLYHSSISSFVCSTRGHYSACQQSIDAHCSVRFRFMFVSFEVCGENKKKILLIRLLGDMEEEANCTSTVVTKN